MPRLMKHKLADDRHRLAASSLRDRNQFRPGAHAIILLGQAGRLGTKMLKVPGSFFADATVPPCTGTSWLFLIFPRNSVWMGADVPPISGNTERLEFFSLNRINVTVG